MTRQGEDVRGEPAACPSEGQNCVKAARHINQKNTPENIRSHDTKRQFHECLSNGFVVLRFYELLNLDVVKEEMVVVQMKPCPFIVQVYVEWRRAIVSPRGLPYGLRDRHSGAGSHRRS